MKELKATSQKGVLSVEYDFDYGTPKSRTKECEVGIQIAEDGRIWICVDGQSFIRFKPLKSSD
jgi:hypothetical protein